MEIDHYFMLDFINETKQKILERAVPLSSDTKKRFDSDSQGYFISVNETLFLME